MIVVIAFDLWIHVPCQAVCQHELTGKDACFSSLELNLATIRQFDLPRSIPHRPRKFTDSLYSLLPF